MRGAFRAGAERLWRDSFSRQIENVGLRLAPVEVVGETWRFGQGLGEGARLSPAVRAPLQTAHRPFAYQSPTNYRPFAYQSAVGYDYAVPAVWLPDICHDSQPPESKYPSRGTDVLLKVRSDAKPDALVGRLENMVHRAAARIRIRPGTGRVHRKRSPSERVCAVYALRLPHARAILLRRRLGNAQHRFTRRECSEHLADARPRARTSARRAGRCRTSSRARRPGASTGLGSTPTCHRTLVALVARLDPSRANRPVLPDAVALTH